jgi:threonine dehydrogenase-like Zn-dependent dehydrogenase
MGAAHTMRWTTTGASSRRCKRLTGGAMCERVIEAVGLQWPLDLAGEITGERGRLVIAGYHQDGKREVNMQMWNWRGIDVINAHERDPRAYVQASAKRST